MYTLNKKETFVAADGLDALVAAPDNHKLLMENERVRVLDTIIRPGETTPVHTHPDPNVFYIISWSDFIRYDDKGQVLLDSRDTDNSSQPPSVLWGEIMPPHAVENVGNTDLHVIGVEIKD